MKTIITGVLAILMVLMPIHSAQAESYGTMLLDKLRIVMCNIPVDNTGMNIWTCMTLPWSDLEQDAITRSASSSGLEPLNTPASEAAPPIVMVTASSAFQAEMLGYINEERVRLNLSPLLLDEVLSRGAALKTSDMAENGYFSHYSPTYGNPFEMMRSLEISYHMAAENIAMNSSVKGAHIAFMNSPPHKANILNPEYRKVGLGFYQQGSRLYVTQWFTD